MRWASDDAISRKSVLKAMTEHDRLGREAFLEEYGFRPARQYTLFHQGRFYDSKAIAGVAYGYEYPARGPLRYDDFHGGPSIQRMLERLGFEIRKEGADLPIKPVSSRLTSDYLIPGETYTRAELSETFGITDATLKTGVFRPKGYDSVWLFVTEKKTADRTAYLDRLEGDLLHWDGQTSGRTDRLVIDHAEQGLELLVFYRRKKDEHPGSGFRYEGPFEYQEHSGSGPTHFLLRRIKPASTVAEAVAVAAAEVDFDPSDDTDARNRIAATIVQRRGQAKFRQDLLDAYGGRCAISGCTVESVLEAAHIVTVQIPSTGAGKAAAGRPARRSAITPAR